MMIQVIINKRGNEERAVVIAPMHAQVDVMVELLTGVRQRIRVQLAVQKLVRRALVHQ